MLKRIPVSHVRLGMHVHKLDGAWLDHPFWRTRFRLGSEAELTMLRSSGVSHCWIDTHLGLDVASPSHDATVAASAADRPLCAAAASAEAVSRTLAATSPPPPASMDEEVRRAARICKSGREAVVGLFAQARMGRALDAESCLPLVAEIADSITRQPAALIGLARLKTADDYTYMHSVAVCALMVALGRQLGMDDAACREAGLAGLMHDLGKALVPLTILNKPGRLTDAEFEQVRRHTLHGHRLLLDSRGASEAVLDVCLHHHERPGGGGYPDALSGHQVSRLARMGAVCDVYDAITSNRPYKSGWDPAESLARMASWSGQFAPDVFQAFVRSLGIYPTGSLVRLASGRLAVVLEQNPQALVSPVVRVFYSTRSEMPVPLRRIDLSAASCNDRIVGREDPQRWGFRHLDELLFDDDVLRRAR